MSELQDPIKNRVVKNCPMPYQRSLTEEQVFTGKTLNWVLLRDFLKREGKLTKKILIELIKKAETIFSIRALMQRRRQI